MRCEGFAAARSPFPVYILLEARPLDTAVLKFILLTLTCKMADFEPPGPTAASVAKNDIESLLHLYGLVGTKLATPEQTSEVFHPNGTLALPDDASQACSPIRCFPKTKPRFPPSSNHQR